MIDASEPSTIREMFGRVAKHYDRVNSVLSVGLHHLWRQRLVSDSSILQAQDVLDCATGTGDLAFELAKAKKKPGRVVGLDFCPQMIELAQQKKAPEGSEVEFLVGDAHSLPFSPKSFDLVTMSFGIRNVQDPVSVLKEMCRVTRVGGEIAILEFGQIPHPALQKGFEWFSGQVLPRVGGWMTGDSQAYQYLHKSSKEFPCGSKFLEWLSQAGWRHGFFVPLSLGIVYLYIAYKTADGGPR